MACVSMRTARVAAARGSAFAGRSTALRRCVGRNVASTRMMAASLQFIRGLDEESVPDVKLTRSRDGTSGTATFVFDEPAVFEATGELGDITGLYMVDDEGTIQTVDVQAKFINGKPSKIEAKYIMRSSGDWNRFMRFMEKYAESNGLGFNKA
eukprot:scaffold287_cov337-Pavlova_lutheri.AAC.208